MLKGNGDFLALLEGAGRLEEERGVKEPNGSTRMLVEAQSHTSATAVKVAVGFGTGLGSNPDS